MKVNRPKKEGVSLSLGSSDTPRRMRAMNWLTSAAPEQRPIFVKRTPKDFSGAKPFSPGRLHTCDAGESFYFGKTKKRRGSTLSGRASPKLFFPNLPIDHQRGAARKFPPRSAGPISRY